MLSGQANQDSAQRGQRLKSKARLATHLLSAAPTACNNDASSGFAMIGAARRILSCGGARVGVLGSLASPRCPQKKRQLMLGFDVSEVTNKADL